MTQLELNRIHQIDENALLSYLEENDYVLTRDDLITILKNDGAHFHNDSMRIYDEKYKCYFQVPEDFELEIDPNQQSNIHIFLWIKSIDVTYKKKVDELTQGLEKVRADIDKINAKIDTILNIQKILYDNQKKSSQTIQTPTTKPISLPYSIKNEPKLPEKFDNQQNVEIDIDKADAADSFELPSVVDLRKQNSVFKFIDGDSPIENLQPRALDIAIVYSEPLVRKVGKNYESLGDPVDYEEECTKLLDRLQAKKKKIDLIFEIASHDRLVSLMAKGPAILHIICHGEYNKERKQFYLCFEADNGELYEFYSENLADILRNVELKIKLVFVNACHSEEVAKIFFEAGVPNVIAIQSELKIADNVAQKFSNHFYDQIFDGKSIKEAFDLAKIASRSADTQTCCCAHSHKNNCLWYNSYAKVEGFQKAHQLHVPLCSDCKKRNQHIHRAKCPWAEGFMLDFEVKHSSPNVGPNELFTCCCSPELTHDESLKFKLICQPDADKMIPFPQKESGKVFNKNPYSVIEQKFPVKRIYGRNRELFQLYDYLIKQDQKFVQLNGSEGVGKTALVKQLANYLYERGHFRDRISIIMLEKTPSISHFLSDLYKETPGAYDFKSFCESIKLNKILFILEKCDLLLENSKDDFIDRLRQISHSAKHVKFILVKNKKERLNLDECDVMIEDLAPYDAAKILLASAYDYLHIDDRRIDNLAKRRLFTEIKFTPQRIWCISERLKHHEDLDTIEEEFLANQELYASKAEASKQDVSITLQTIKSVSQPCYELVLAIGLFPSGLTTDDLNELSFLGMLPENWRIVMKRLTRNPSEIAEINNDIEDQKATQEQWDTKTDYQLLIPGNYFWVVITKDPTKEILQYLPAQFVNKFIDMNLRLDPANFDMQKLQYMTLLALSIIKRLKEVYYYHEKLIEHSSICNHGIWNYDENNTFYKQYIKDKRSYSYVDEFHGDSPKALDLVTMRKIFEFHEPNFLSCIESDTVMSIIQFEGTRYGEIIDVLEIAWIAIPTLYKLFAANESGARDLCLRALKMLGDLEYRDQKLYLLRAKLHLFLASFYIHEDNRDTNAYQTIHAELEYVSKTQGDIQNEEIQKALSHHVVFTKAYLYFKIRMGRFLQNEKADKKKHLMKKYEEILQMLKQCEDHLSTLSEFFDVERSKITILISKIILKNLKTRKGIEAKITDNVKSAIGVFNVYNLKRLEIVANYQFALIRLNLKRYNSSKTDSNSKQIKLTDSLAQAKNHYLNRNALQIVKLINDKAFEAKIKRLVDDINTEIRQGYFNVLILMRASSIVEMQAKQLKQENQKVESEAKAVGFPTRVASFYKNDLIKALNDKKKTLYLKFEILSKANLTDSLQNGCRILQMNCNIVQTGGVVLEDPIGCTDFVSYSELKEIFTSRSAVSNITPQEQMNTNTSPTPSIITQKNSSTFANEHYLDLLILGSKNDPATASFFADDIRIPHVIAFRFLNKEFDFRHKVYEDQCIDKFSQFLLEEIVDGFSVRESFNVAYQRTFDSLSETFFESRDNSYIRNIIGEGPILLPEGADHNEVLYGIDDYTLNDGHIEDISSVRYPTNIPKTVLPFTGRNNDIYAVVKLLVKLKFQFVKLSGEVGIGKTAFALHAGYFLLTRNIFPDGIFYFPLKNMKNLELKDMMKETFGPKFENNMKNFFRDKKMLLIFDDFDVFYLKGQEFPRLIFLTLRECEIATLVIATSRRKQEIITKKKWQQEYDMRQKAIEDEFLRTERILKPMKDEEMAHILLSMVKIDKNMDVDIDRIKTSHGIRLAEGNPRALINSLMEKKIIIDKKPLEINPKYIDLVHIDQNINHLSVNHSLSSMKSLLQRHGSEISESGLKLSKLNSNLSTKSHLPHTNSNESLQAVKANSRSKSSTTQGFTNRLSQEEKKEKQKEKQKEKASLTGITESHADKSHDKSDDDGRRPSKRFNGKPRPMTTKLQREKSYSSKNDSTSEFPKKDSSVSEENQIPFDSTVMDYYEEQKSNDADELLRGLSSNEDEKDDVFQVNMDENHSNNEESNSEDDLALPVGSEDKGYHSQEEGMGLDSSISETILTFGESFERQLTSDLAGPGNESTSRMKGKFSTTKKKGTTNQQKDDNQKKKKSNNKGQKSGKQVNRFTKSKKNKFLASRDGGSGNKRKGSTGSNEED